MLADIFTQLYIIMNNLNIMEVSTTLLQDVQQEINNTDTFYRAATLYAM